MKLIKISLPWRVRLWLLLCLTIIAISTLVRIALLIKSWSHADCDFWRVAGIFFFGFLFDLVNAVYFSLPLAVYLWLAPERLFNTKWNVWVLRILFFLFTIILMFSAVAECLFWDEFGTRYNFIAVDYLVYTTEVIGNINESYPAEWILSGIVMLSILTTILMRKYLKCNTTQKFTFKKRSWFMLGYSLLFLIAIVSVNSRIHQFTKNTIVNELAGNGIYELFVAYLNNELDYHRFYATMDNEAAFGVTRALLSTKDASSVSGQLQRKIVNPGQEKRLNVVLISVESLSADFMEQFGNKENITPFLDSLSRHSLLFTNLYATGTRTVRGLEALSLCVPPTPGQSIVRRPNNEHLFSMATVLRSKGYQCKYIYGGYGYFDNMNYFFGHNNYEVLDRTALADNQIHYENIWGVADEDLFTLALNEINEATKKSHRPVFAHVMTTSNHRPFTYPEGRIDIPSHSSRAGAVKYTDYAIGQFIKRASRESWFANTVFVIVADHCASSAGKTELPVQKYHIPMLVYSPTNVPSGTMNRLMSQIDVSPSILGLLNFSYESKFYGYDIFKLEPGRERAFISTYQSLGYIKDKTLVILSPRQKTECFALSDTMEIIAESKDSTAVQEAIAWYQTASYSFHHGLMKE